MGKEITAAGEGAATGVTLSKENAGAEFAKQVQAEAEAKAEANARAAQQKEKAPEQQSLRSKFTELDSTKSSLKNGEDRLAIADEHRIDVDAGKYSEAAKKAMQEAAKTLDGSRIENPSPAAAQDHRFDVASVVGGTQGVQQATQPGVRTT